MMLISAMAIIAHANFIYILILKKRSLDATQQRLLRRHCMFRKLKVIAFTNCLRAESSLCFITQQQSQNRYLFM